MCDDEHFECGLISEQSRDRTVSLVDACEESTGF